VAQHLCAFSNHEGGGFLVYGMNDDGTMFSVTREDADAVIKKLGNIALNNLSQSVQIQHETFDFCELWGSGIDRAIEAVEKAIFPAPKFIRGDFYTKGNL
jgi:predicted HTH transcriptional regulator